MVVAGPAKHVKISCIGGGSRAWVPQMMRDLALDGRVCGHISLYDISYGAARENVTRGKGIFAHADARSCFSVSAHRKIAPALQGADFVVMAIQPGPIGLMARDIGIPLKYGILHTVGDTAGPAGTMRGLRTVPIYAEYAHHIMERCPRAWVLNCTNPIAVSTWALYRAEPQIKAFGYCHEVFHTQRHLAQIAQERFGVESIDRREVRVDVAGVNHFTMCRAARWEGRDLFPLLRERTERPGFYDSAAEIARKRKKEGQWFDYEWLVAYDFLRRFGVFGAAGDRHLVEFVPWYIGDEDTLHRWGVVRTPPEYRLRSAAGRLKDKQLDPPEKLEPSGGETVEQLLALAGLGDLETNTNVPNRGQVQDLPHGCVLESIVRFRRDALEPRLVGEFPPTVNALQRRIVDVQRTVVEAALSRGKELAFQAILCDPLTTISTDAAWQMFNEMLQATKNMLPGWDL